MRFKVLMWTSLLRYGKKARAIRNLARSKGVPIRSVLELVADLEANSIEHAGYIIDEAKRKQIEETQKVINEIPNFERPRNVVTASSPVG